MKIKAWLYLMFIVALVSFVMPATTALAADDEHGCTHNHATVQDLRDCVNHAIMAGHITNQGVANSLLAKLDAAHAAVKRGQIETAINNLQAFVHAVEAQAGKHIVPGHAEHMIMHANQVIAALS